MKKVVRIATVVPLAWLLGCGQDAPTQPSPPPRAAPAPATVPSAGAEPTPTGDPAARAAEVVKTLGDADLVGQVLMPYAYGNTATKVDADKVQRQTATLSRCRCGRRARC